MYTNAWLGNRILEFGTTATLALVQDDTLALAHVGDTLAVIGRLVVEFLHLPLLLRRSLQ